MKLVNIENKVFGGEHYTGELADPEQAMAILTGQIGNDKLMLPASGRAIGLSPERRRTWISLLCPTCEVTWRGRPDTPCWSCEGEGVQTASTITIVD